MINNIFSKLISSNNRYLFESKQKIKEIAKKRAKDSFPIKLPTASSLVSKLNQLNISQPEDLLKAEQYYINTTSALDNIIRKIEGNIEEMSSIRSKLKAIDDNFSKIDEILEVVNPILVLIRAALPTLDILLASQNPVTGINGLSLKKTMDKIDTLKDKIESALDIITFIPISLRVFLDETSKLIEPLNKSIDGMEAYLAQLKNLRDQIDQIYQNFISQFVFPSINDEVLGTDQTPEQFIVENIDNLPTLLSKVTNTYFITYQEGNKITKYEIKKI